MKTTENLTASTLVTGARYLLVTGDGGLRVHPLPERGELVLGRDEDCDVIVDHPKVSRRHASLSVEEKRVTFTDLGSRNGTTFRGQRLEPNQPHEMAIGESFAIGPLSLMVLPAGSTSAPVTPSGTSLRVEDPTDANASPLLTAIARAPASVLIRGETGAGKEVLAATLHALSGRKGPFLAVNCAAVSDSLLESELFGHEKGAFTGAAQAKPGLLEAAAGGTVLLDEIGEMPPPLQAKLLRATEAREVLRVGGLKPIAIDARFLAATHRDLLAPGSTFRRDLYYRLAAVTLMVPPLRERRARIGVLAASMAAGRAALSPPATEKLTNHDWPGNVRELRNVLDRAVLLAGGKEIRPEHIVFDTHTAHQVVPTTTTTTSDDEAADRARIIAALEACAGNQTKAAKELGVSRATLVHKLALYRIPRPRKP
jgi:DNA-binding NtrC family response regulator